MTIGTPSRSLQIVSCSTAAARNVSPAPSTTFLPCEWNSRASLAIVVVLPLPLTPQTMITVGPLSANLIGASSWAISVEQFVLDRFRTTARCVTTRARKSVAICSMHLLDGVVAHVRS